MFYSANDGRGQYIYFSAFRVHVIDSLKDGTLCTNMFFPLFMYAESNMHVPIQVFYFSNFYS